MDFQGQDILVDLEAQVDPAVTEAPLASQEVWAAMANSCCNSDLFLKLACLVHSVCLSLWTILCIRQRSNLHSALQRDG